MSAYEENRQAIGAHAPLDRVVLMHCSASSTRQWRTLVEQLSTFQAVPLDLWGHGLRERWHGAGPLRLREEAAAIEAACPGGGPFHLVGHSYGGAVALKFASSHAGRVRSLTLIEPSCFHILKTGDGVHAHLLEEIRSVADVINRSVLRGDYASGMEAFIDYWGGAGSWQSLADEKKTQLLPLALHVAHHFWSLIEEQTQIADYGRIEVPTLIVCGTLSPAPSRTITRLLAEAMPRVRHRTLRNAGHMSPLTHAAEVNRLVLEHLTLNSGPSNMRWPLVVAAE